MFDLLVFFPPAVLRIIWSTMLMLGTLRFISAKASSTYDSLQENRRNNSYTLLPQ